MRGLDPVEFDVLASFIRREVIWPTPARLAAIMRLITYKRVGDGPCPDCGRTHPGVTAAGREAYRIALAVRSSLP